MCIGQLALFVISVLHKCLISEGGEIRVRKEEEEVIEEIKNNENGEAQATQDTREIPACK